MQLKNLFAAMLAIFGLTLANAVFSGPVGQPTVSMRCEPPVLQMSEEGSAALYWITCEGADSRVIAPEVRFTGEVATGGTPPYDVKASYTINVQGAHSKRLQSQPRADQVATGKMTGSTVSVAALPAQFAAQMVWDASSGALSVEESAGRWRIFSSDYLLAADEPGIMEAGLANTPVVNGRATSTILFDTKDARFGARQSSTAPGVTVELRLFNGRLELVPGDTRAANQRLVQDALLSLDKNPKDILRAWALASRARFLALEPEVNYAERKVAAHHPHLLEEFQRRLQRIQPYGPANP